MHNPEMASVLNQKENRNHVMSGNVMRAAVCVAGIALLFCVTACKALFSDIEEDFSYWASESAVTGFTIASPVRTSPAGVQCVPSADDAVITLTVRNPKKFSFVMPDSSGAPADIVTFESGIHDALGTNPPVPGTDYTLGQSAHNTLTLTYSKAFLKRYEQSRANIGASIRLYSTDGRKFNHIYKFNLEANTPPPNPAPVFASDDNHIALFKTAAADSQGKRYYVLCFKVAGFAEPGAPDLHSDLTHVYVSKNGGDEIPYSVTLKSDHSDFDIAHSGGTFIAETDVDKLSNAEAEASPGSNSPLPDNVPSDSWVLYFKTDVPVGGGTTKYRIRLFDGKLYSDYAQKSTSTRELSVPKVFAHADIDNVAAFGVYTEATEIVTPGTIATVDSNDLNGGGAPIGGVSPDGSDETHAIPVYSAYGEAVKLTIKKTGGTDYPAGVTVTGSAEKHSGDSVSGAASFTAGQSAVVTLPSPTDGGGEAVYKVVFKATGEGFDDSATRTLYYKVRREIKAVNNLPMWYMLGAAIKRIPLGGAGTVKISGTIKAENIGYPPLPDGSSVVNNSTIDVSGKKESGVYPGRTVTVIGDSKTSSILDASNLCSVFNVEFNGKLILKNVTLQNGKSSGGNGGGICIGYNGSSCEMTDTDITNCISSGGMKLGGAVYVKIGGSLTVGSGCVISGNTAPGGKGAGIYVESGGTFNIAGNAQIDEGNDVFLEKNADVPYDSSKNAKITVAAPLTGTHTVAKITPEDYTAGVTAVNAASGVDIGGYAGRFKITDQTIISPPSTVLWKLRYNSNNTLVLKSAAPTVIPSGSDAWKTLKEAIEAESVEDGDEFVIKGSIKATNAPGNSGGITVTKKITVRGDGTNPELDANSNHTGTPPADAPATPHRIFTVEDGGELTLENLTLKGGNEVSDYGGAIHIKTGSAADIRNTRIYGCKALNGGAICNKGTLILSECHIGSNTDANEAKYEGGAIFSMATDPASCTIKGTDITYNKAGRSGGGICIVKGKCTIEPKGTTPTLIDHNTCSGSSAKGGGIYVGAAGSCTIKSLTKISNNGGALCKGGGIYNAGTLEIEGNSSGKVEIVSNNGEFGGGIYHQMGILTTKYTEIKNNSATLNGGGIHAAGSCTLDEGTVIGGAGFDNTVTGAGSSGGGVYVAGTFVMKSDARIVPPTTAVAGKNDVYLMPDKYITLKTSLTGTAPVARITPSRYIVGRAVVKGDGYTLTATDTSRFTLTPNGGDEWGIKADGTLVLNAVTVDGTNPAVKAWEKLRQAVNNVADGGTVTVKGTVQATNVSGNYGAISVKKKITVKGEGTNPELDADKNAGDGKPKHRIFTVEDGGELTLENITLKNGMAAGTTDDEKCGGGILVKAGCKAKLKNCSIKNCEAAEFGGAICSEGELTLDGGTIGGASTSDGNKATNQGGGICIQKNGRFTLKTATISENKATYGGAVCVRESGSVSMESGFLTTNTVGFLGGGVHVDGSSASFTMTGGKIKTNNANGGGGGVYVHSGTFTLSDSASIESNIAEEQNGGGIYVDSTGKLEIKGGSIKSNKATKTSGGTGMGGGVYVFKGMLDMSGGSIEGNGAGENGGSYEGSGGGVYIDGGTFTTTGGEIKTNNAKNGGGVYAEGGAEITLKNTKINSCVAEENGGGLYIKESTLTLKNATIGGDQLYSGTQAGVTKGNKAKNGGGIYIEKSASFTMQSGDINDNKAEGGTTAHGGGVCIIGQGSDPDTQTSFTLNGGTIGGNRADHGGGVMADAGGKFTMNNGTISNNTALYGGGVRVDRKGSISSIFTMKNGTITDNGATQNGKAVSVYGIFYWEGGSITGNTSGSGDVIHKEPSGTFSNTSGNTAS